MRHLRFLSLLTAGLVVGGTVWWFIAATYGLMGALLGLWPASIAAFMAALAVHGVWKWRSERPLSEPEEIPSPREYGSLYPLYLKNLMTFVGHKDLDASAASLMQQPARVEEREGARTKDY